MIFEPMLVLPCHSFIILKIIVFSFSIDDCIVNIAANYSTLIFEQFLQCKVRIHYAQCTLLYRLEHYI